MSLICCAMIAAPRKSDKSLRMAYWSMKEANLEPFVFAEPGTVVDAGMSHTINNERLGNFWNWQQAAEQTLLSCSRLSADACLIAEDDALHSREIRPFLNRIMWPDPTCGAISLYCPNLRYFRRPSPHLFPSSRPNHVGALSLLFRPECLAEILNDTKSINEWGGSWDQKGRTVPRCELKAVDAWIGETMLKHGWRIWVCSRSLVQHYHPPEAPDNSTLSHGSATRSRSAFQWIGLNGDPWKVYRLRPS